MASSSSAASPTRTRTFCCDTGLPPSCCKNLKKLSVERKVLRLEELHQAVMSAFAPEAALLGAAERRRRVGHDAAIEPDHAGLDSLADGHRPPQVAAADEGHQAVLGVVGPPHGLVLGRARHDRGHGPEDLFAQQLAAELDVVEHR